MSSVDQSEPPPPRLEEPPPPPRPPPPPLRPLQPSEIDPLAPPDASDEIINDEIINVPSSSPELPTTQLRELTLAQRAEIGSQHRELLRLRSVVDSAESERVRLAQRVAKLTSERDQYLLGLTNASQLVQELRIAAERADAVHEQQRKEDTATFQANVRRLLAEKASLHDEVELMTSQKDALTEALVKANHALGEVRLDSEEADAYKQQHREAAERLQSGLAERDAAKSIAEQLREQSRQLSEQLATARQTITAQVASADQLRQQLESATESRDHAQQAAQRGSVRGRRLEASLLALTTEMRSLELALASAASGAAHARSRERCQVATCLVEVAVAEAAEAAAMDVARRHAAQAAAATAERSAAAAARDESVKETRDAREGSEARIASLTAERDSALGELAAQKRVTDSLRAELRKAMKQVASTPAS